MLTAHYGAFRRAKTTPSRCQELSVGPVYFFGPFLGFFDFFFELVPLTKPTFASKYSLESSRRDLHNALLCTVLVELSNLKLLVKFRDFFLIYFAKIFAFDFSL